MHSTQISSQTIPAHEELRLQKLYEYEILDTPGEKSFDNFAQLAADIFEVPNATIGFFTEKNIFLKAQIGTSLDKEISKSIINVLNKTGEVWIIDAETPLTDPQNTSTPTFFAGGVIKSPEGQNLGVIMAYGNESITATAHQITMLKRLAEMVMERMEIRMAIRKTLRAQDDRLHVLIHDLKNPMTTISLQSELVSRMPDAGEKASAIAGKINHQSKRMVDHLNQILSSARKENGSFKPQKTKIDLRGLLLSIIQELKAILKGKNQSFKVNIDAPVEIFGDEHKLRELFMQLLQNASKFSDRDTEIFISHQIEENLVTIAIKDEGVGLSEDDLDRLFIKFSRLSSAPTAHENSNGLGLISAKMFIDMHKGKLWATSEGKNKGTTFFVALPIK